MYVHPTKVIPLQTLPAEEASQVCDCVEQHEVTLLLRFPHHCCHHLEQLYRRCMEERWDALTLFLVFLLLETMMTLRIDRAAAVM